jgi:hypothetical protein
VLPTAKAALLRRLGRHAEARVAYHGALERVQNPAERKYLEKRLAMCKRIRPPPVRKRTLLASILTAIAGVSLFIGFLMLSTGDSYLGLFAYFLMIYGSATFVQPH